jgi:general stress protein YciG
MELADFPADDGKNKAAQWLGQRGGKARAKALSPQRRREIAKKAAKSRWG